LVGLVDLVGLKKKCFRYLVSGLKLGFGSAAVNANLIASVFRILAHVQKLSGEPDVRKVVASLQENLVIVLLLTSSSVLLLLLLLLLMLSCYLSLPITVVVVTKPDL
jgi:hypothetical protein